MTPDLERAERLADELHAKGDFYLEQIVRACIAGAREENWDKPLYSGQGFGSALFESSYAHRFLVNGSTDNDGFEFFQRALTVKE